MIGQILAERYQIVAPIGEGGMALVFLAKDLRTGHNVAVKFLRPEFKENPDFLGRFHHEATAASKMSHHNIVNLLDVSDGAENPYIVIEYVDGKTLKDIIRENLGSKEFFINKAIGWALRTYSRVDAQAVRSFVAETDLHPLSAREALKWLERKGL